MKSYIILLIFLKIIICSKIITIPFRFEFKKSSYYSYNSTNFLNEYYRNNFLLELTVGSPPQKINALINQYSSCFQFKSTKSSVTKNYSPNNSTSLKIKETPNLLSKLFSAFDIFNFGQNQTHKISFEFSESLSMSLNKDNLLIPIIGLKPTLPHLNLCPNLFDDLKNIKAIDKKIFNIKYDNKFGGEFILGNDLTKFDNKNYKESQYTKSYFYDEFYFKYDKIYLKYPWNKTEYLNISEINIKKEPKEAKVYINNGFIIGTEEFKNFIHEKFFKYLVEKKICSLDLTELNETDEKLGNEFYLYNCYHMQFTGQSSQRHKTINYYEEFPNLVINSKNLEYNFELTNKDLFEQIYSRDYFLIIFPKKNVEEKNKNIWYLGEPFYKKYPFTIDFDAKTIGFYSKETINKNETKIEIVDNKDKNKVINDNNSKVKNILFKIGEILVVIGLLFGAYFIGIKVKEGRKKRANELKDDYYEYITDSKNDINKHDNDEKDKQIVELNSKLGL